MASGGTRRAALLLMSLDSTTAAELVRAAGPEMVKKIAAEVAYLHASGKGKRKADSAASDNLVREFYAMVRKGNVVGGAGFIKDMLDDALGPQKAKEAMGEVYDKVTMRDPFLPIKNAAPQEIAQALEGELPQVVALIVSELPPEKSIQLLPLLSDEVRSQVVCAIAGGIHVSDKFKSKVAGAIHRRLVGIAESGSSTLNDDANLRQVAVLLQKMAKELRDKLVGAIKEQDEQKGQVIESLMVIWEDVARVAGKCLQEALRSVDARGLALALVGSDEIIAGRINENVSERLRGMLEEEATLLSNPKPAEVEKARESILDALRKMHSKGDLDFEDSEEGE